MLWVVVQKRDGGSFNWDNNGEHRSGWALYIFFRGRVNRHSDESDEGS